MRVFVLLCGALLFGASAVAADTSAEIKGKEPTLSIDARPTANLIYQLDCMADLIRCAPDIFQNLWHKELQFDEADQKALDEWRRLREAIGQRERSTTPEPEIGTTFPLVASDDPTLWFDVQQAAYGAADLASIDAAESRVLPADEVATLHRIVEHFQPRFEAWWSHNSDTATAFVPALNDAMKKARGLEIVTSTIRFYGAELPDHHIQIHVVALPKGEIKATSAIRIGSHLVVEVIPGETAEQRVDVVVHELAHYVFGSMPRARKAKFMEQMLSTGPGGIPSWSLFEEVQATVIGNIMAFRNLSTPQAFAKAWAERKFYSSDVIDLGARATHQVFDTAFAHGGEMRPNFPADYVEAMRKGPKLDTAAAYLNTMASLTLDPTDKRRNRQIRRKIHTTAAYEYDSESPAEFAARAKQYPDLSVAVLLRTDQLDKVDALGQVLATSAQELKQALGSSNGLIFVTKRSQRGYAFVLVARNDASIEALIAALPQCTITPGICKTL